ncbi:hypothetical protein [Methylobacterium frigidaeris]|uniref:Uncharacterized protein n=1 Tax=Methylobacterium frigidaeris TaxID=2038277 RepID=A0AA37H786_9HYPH|nr:hypothetical protein [Methylobacterium frigidaeris]GJD60229.1 hypothetical protein MPEAHAMD_0365 [Methylobacterium frigidaeris]
MTLADALRDHDLGALGRDLQTAALHQDRCRRHAERLEGLHDLPVTHQARANIDVTVSALAGADRLVMAVSRFLADERTGQPPSDDAPPLFVQIGGRRLDLRRVANLMERHPCLVEAVEAVEAGGRVTVEQPVRPRGAPEVRLSRARALTAAVHRAIGPAATAGRTA